MPGGAGSPGAVVVMRLFNLAATAALTATSTIIGAAVPNPPIGLDHILVGAPDLDRAVAEVQQRTGVRAVYGGSHPRAGTRNALIAIGNGAYLEIIAPDPAQARPGGAAKFLRSLKTLTPIGWAYHTGDLSTLHSGLRARGVRAGRIEPGSRKRPDGQTLRWRTFEIGGEEDVAPFYIEWGRTSPHPSLTAARGCRLAQFVVGGPLKPNVVHALALTGQSAVWQRNAPDGLQVALQCGKRTIRF